MTTDQKLAEMARIEADMAEALAAGKRAMAAQDATGWALALRFYNDLAGQLSAL